MTQSARSSTPRSARDELIEAGNRLARALYDQSTAPPKPAPCVAHLRTDGRPDCPNCAALARWERAIAAVRGGA